MARVKEIFKTRVKVGCTACGYCLPCPEKVAIPKILGHYNNYFLMDAEEARARAKFFFTAQSAPEESPGNCVACRQCEEKCPQGLPISETLAAAAKIFV